MITLTCSCRKARPHLIQDLDLLCVTIQMIEFFPEQLKHPVLLFELLCFVPKVSCSCKSLYLLVPSLMGSKILCIGTSEVMSVRVKVWNSCNCMFLNNEFSALRLR